MHIRLRSVVATTVFLASVGLALAFPTVFPSGLTIWKPETDLGIVIFRGQDGIVRAVAPNGKTIHAWVSPDPETILGYAEPLLNGNILVYQRPEPEAGCGFNCGDVFELDWDGNVVGEYSAPAGVSLHHDFQRLENGNTLFLCAQDFIDENISPLELRDDCLFEIDTEGQPVWSWQTADHFDEFEFSDEAKALIAEQGGDWGHANAAWAITSDTPHSDPRFAPGNIIVSYRATNFIIIIDRETGEIVWKTDELTIGQHNAHMLTNDQDGAGNILVFDNGGSAGYPVVARLESRIREIDPLDMSIPWSYDATMSGLPRWNFFSSFISSAQRLPNGNTFIDEGANGRLFEITSDGEIVWEFVVPKIYGQLPNGEPTPGVYRATKVPLDWLPMSLPSEYLYPPD